MLTKPEGLAAGTGAFARTDTFRVIILHAPDGAAWFAATAPSKSANNAFRAGPHRPRTGQRTSKNDIPLSARPPAWEPVPCRAIRSCRGVEAVSKNFLHRTCCKKIPVAASIPGLCPAAEATHPLMLRTAETPSVLLADIAREIARVRDPRARHWIVTPGRGRSEHILHGWASLSGIASHSQELELRTLLDQK